MIALQKSSFYWICTNVRYSPIASPKPLQRAPLPYIKNNSLAHVPHLSPQPTYSTPTPNTPPPIPLSQTIPQSPPPPNSPTVPIIPTILTRLPS